MNFGTRENLPGFAHQKLPTKSRQIDGVFRPPDGTRVQQGRQAAMRRRETKTLHAFGADEIESSILARGQDLFFVWVTLSEHKQVTSRERRGTGDSHCPVCRTGIMRTVAVITPAELQVYPSSKPFDSS
jgi:hypothetical protein